MSAAKTRVLGARYLTPLLLLPIIFIIGGCVNPSVNNLRVPTAIGSLADNRPLTVMSFNIRVGAGIEDFGTSPYYLPKGKNLADVVEAIRSVDPDIVGLQEVGGGSQAFELASALNMNYVYQSHVPSTWWGLAILSKYPIKTAEGLRMSGSSCGSRNFMIATIDINDHPMAILNTHLCHNASVTSGSSVRGLLSRINEIQGPIILTGDLNIGPRDWRVELLEERLLDTAKAASKANIGTWGGTSQRIDYVFVDQKYFEVHHVGVTPKEHWGASDHLGIYALVSLNSGGDPSGKKAARQALLPMAKPKHPVGYERHTSEEDDKPVVASVTSSDDKSTSWKKDGQCAFTIFDYFGPNKPGEHCGDRPGTKQVICKRGNVWPLEIGNNVQYWHDTSCSFPPRQTRDCEVNGQERVQTALGEFDTFRVVCTESDTTETWWMSPEIRDVVRFRRVHFRHGISEAETTRIEMP